MILLRTNGKFPKQVQDQELLLARRQVFFVNLSLFGPIAVPLKRQSAKIERMQSSTILCVKNWMVRILSAGFCFGNLSSCALAASVSHRVGVGTDRINVCIPAPRNTKKSYVCFRSTCGARPYIYARFPICLNAWDAIGTCGELTICRANIIVT